MSYTKTVWKDLPDTTTPITADRLNNIENGVEYLYENGLIAQNLPVGSEVDYVGQISDIPSGWEQITSEQTLWTNTTPTSDFIPQTITLSSSDYDVLGIYYYDYKTTKNMCYSQALKGENFKLNSQLNVTNNYFIVSRYFTRTSDTSYTCDNTIGISASATGTIAAHNDQIIPVKIVGYNITRDVRIKRVS